MNHLTLLPTKKTNKLFLDKYRYKVVLTTKFAPLFRNKDINSIINKIEFWKNIEKFPPYVYGGNKSDYDIAINIANTINSINAEYKVMVSNPRVSFYTDNETDFNILTKILKNQIRFISIPSKTDVVFEKNTIYLKYINFDYKITISNCINNKQSFLNWCKDNNKIRMSKNCQRHLMRGLKKGYSYFYVKDAKSLSVVQMFIGSNIHRIDRVIKIIS
jgi:hypothetical protein